MKILVKITEGEELKYYGYVRLTTIEELYQFLSDNQYFIHDFDWLASDDYDAIMYVKTKRW